jgi:hypothetical protein
VGSAGVQKLFFGVSTHLDLNPEHCVLKLDFSNAFNSVWRARVLEAIAETPEWQHLYAYFWATLSPACVVNGIGSLSDEGVVQGSAGGPAGLCMAIHKYIVWADEEMRQRGGFVVFDMDDGYIVGGRRTCWRWWASGEAAGKLWH